MKNEDMPTLAARLEKLERFAASVTDLHLRYAEEARRYAEILAECVAVREAILGSANGVAPEIGVLIAESARRTPAAPEPAAAVLFQAKRPEAPRRRHRASRGFVQVG